MTKIKNKTDLAIFTALEKINGDLKLFILENGEKLDNAFVWLYSERTLINSDKTNEQYANLVNSLFAKKWDSAYDLFTSANTAMSNLGINGDKEKVTTETITDTQDDTNTLSAYNVEDFSNNDKDTKNYNRQREVKENEKNTDIDINNFSVSWDYLSKNYIQDIVFNDVISMITLRVYESEEK